MKHRRIIAVAALGVLAACGSTDIKDSLGLTHRAPDEFRVYQHPPLSVPPEFALSPPAKGSEYSNGMPADVEAHNKMLSDTGAATPPAPVAPASVIPAPAAQQGSSHFLVAPMGSVAATPVPAVSASELPSSADSQFLADAGAAKADPHIRDKLDQDKGASIAPKNSPYLLGNKKEGDSLVDPAREAERLKQDKAQDKPPTVGDTPVIQTKDKGWLGDIF